MYTEVAQKWLEDRPGQDNVQRELLQKAARLYEVFLGEEGSDPEVRERTALASYRVARIRHSLRQIDEAEQAYRRAIDLQEHLCTDFPANARYRQELAQSFTWLGELLRETGRPFREAEQAYRSARDLAAGTGRRGTDGAWLSSGSGGEPLQPGDRGDGQRPPLGSTG